MWGGQKHIPVYKVCIKDRKDQRLDQKQNPTAGLEQPQQGDCLGLPRPANATSSAGLGLQKALA